MKIGLLIIDMQCEMENQVKKQTIDAACEYINHVADLLRSNQQTVIHIKDVEGAEDPSAAALDFLPEIKIDPKDIQITKEFSNAFWKTELENIVTNHEIDLLVVSGFAAEQCVTFTYGGAIERGFKAVILQRGILSTNSEAVLEVYRDRHLISYPVIEALVNKD